MGQVVEALDEVSLDWLDLDEERPPVDIFEELQEATSPAWRACICDCAKGIAVESHPKESNCLKHFIINPIQPCRYQFPIADFDAAIALAATFTGILLGTLQDVVVRLAGNNDVDLTRVMAATIGNEGE
ncbi:hypothetical protein BDV23DRAFT_178085 [Aspergillus alliaceus]|uniref:Uncharacterized protein n=1 Tax=Petromyces alliaceus TaxID=209559 RepID=A0A5N7CPB4_PETAA|nr:hypothetical protein BDV23DRAFT_178085 [Aspergillus alliaceus]